jgi:ABC-type antimicrobial peptide transport system permease subunit
VGLASLLLANAGTLPGLNGFGMSLSLSPSLLASMLVLSGLIGLLSGLTPAVSAYRAGITTMLRQV